MTRRHFPQDKNDGSVNASTRAGLALEQNGSPCVAGPHSKLTYVYRKNRERSNGGFGFLGSAVPPSLRVSLRLCVRLPFGGLCFVGKWWGFFKVACCFRFLAAAVFTLCSHNTHYEGLGPLLFFFFRRLSVHSLAGEAISSCACGDAAGSGRSAFCFFDAPPRIYGLHQGVPLSGNDG